MDITDLLVFTHKNKASDLHLSANNPPVIRIQGDMIPYKSPPLPANELKQMLFSIMTEQQRSEYEREYELDFAISIGDSRFRVNAFNTLNGPAAVLRTIPTEI